MKVFIRAEKKRDKTFFLVLSILFLILFLNGAIPFVSVPTFGQAIWTTGFSLSFADDPYLSVHANNVGYPNPAAIAFGLSGALPMSFLLRMGMSPADAYSSIVAFWLIVAFFACRSICVGLKIDKSISTILALLWMSQPVIWNHAGYSMLSIGVALLSLYFYAALRLFVFADLTPKSIIFTAVLYFCSCLISVFMDGYTFMMFAVGSSFLGAWSLLMHGISRRYLFGLAYPLHLLSFGIAYLLYSSYVGGGQYEPETMDFFRGWGADILFFVLPTEGVYWLWDALGLSVPRSQVDLFGDGSVWGTTFILPVLFLGVWVWFYAKKASPLLYAAVLVALFGFYMSLGPSLKFNSIKSGYIGSEMPVEYAVAPTGSAIISENLPGFKSMRASYRWTALGVFCLWLVIAISFSHRRNARFDGVFIAAVLLVVISGLPDMRSKWVEYKNNRLSFSQIDRGLVGALKSDIKRGEVVAFLPYRNDFMATYIAPAAGFNTFNIGGDKGLAAARNSWPESLKILPAASIDGRVITSALTLLAENESDVVIFPYVDFERFYSWPVPLTYKDELLWALKTFEETGLVDIYQRDYYFAIRLRAGAGEKINDAGGLINYLCPEIYPVSMASKSCSLPFFLRGGWYAMEAKSLWSYDKSSLRIYTPKACKNVGGCSVSLTLSVYGATASKPKHVFFKWVEPDVAEPEVPSLSFSDDHPQSVNLTLSSKVQFKDLQIYIPDAVSPVENSSSYDARVLGVSFHGINVVH